MEQSIATTLTATNWYQRLLFLFHVALVCQIKIDALSMNTRRSAAFKDDRFGIDPRFLAPFVWYLFLHLDHSEKWKLSAIHRDEN